MIFSKDALEILIDYISFSFTDSSQSWTVEVEVIKSFMQRSNQNI